jgi:hypothetical protein
MFSQVVSTLLRLTERHADHWLAVQGSHEVPVYGFERLGDPPPLQVDVARLLDELGKGTITVGDEWAAALAPETLTVVQRLADEARVLAEGAVHGDPQGTLDGATFNFPDETWARVVYDTILAQRAGKLSTERLVTALVPLYFGRVASLILETRELTTDQAEAFVERQARAFELAKPYLVRGWEAIEVPKTQRRRSRASA